MLGQSFYASRSTSISSPCLLSLKQSQGAMSKKSEEKILFIFFGKGKIHMPLKNMTSSLSILAATYYFCSRKVHISPYPLLSSKLVHKGEGGGQNCPKIGPHDLRMTPYYILMYAN